MIVCLPTSFRGRCVSLELKLFEHRVFSVKNHVNDTGERVRSLLFKVSFDGRSDLVKELS